MKLLEIGRAVEDARRGGDAAFAVPAFVVEPFDGSPIVAPGKGVVTTRNLRKDDLRAEIDARRDLVRADAWVAFAEPGQELVRFGRSAASDVVLPYASLSRDHAVVQRREGRWVIADPGSRNGIALNGRSLEPRQWVPIANDDTVVLGECVKVRVFLVAAALQRTLAEVELAPKIGLPEDAGPAPADDDTRTIRLAVETRFFRILDDLSNYGVIIADGQGRVILFNDAGRRILGGRELGPDPTFWARELGLFQADRTTPLPGESMPLVGAIRGSRSDDVELFVQNDGVPRGAWIRVTGRPILGIPRFTGAIMFFHDITEAKRLEEQRRQEQKMEAIGLLAGGIAHDFNNLLTVVNGRAELLLSHLDAADPLREDADEIRKVGERAAALTRQLLAFSRKQILKPVVVDLNAVVGDMDRLLRRLVGEHIALETRMAESIWRVTADPGQLQQVILNLVVNARDAMSDGGRVSIETKNVERAADAEGGLDVPAGRYVVLEVKDDGKGMDEATRAHLFEPFFSTKPVGAGTGLGLSVVYGIVKQSGGHVAVASEVGRGTTIRIFLPRVEAPLAEAAPDAPAANRRGTETILLVEDEDGVRRLARRILEGGGYHVIDARNGEEALRLAGGGEPIDLLLTDVVMPVLGGYALHEALVKRGQAPPALFMSGYAEDGKRDGLGDTRPFLPKPFTPAGLLEKVRAVLEGAAR